VEAVPEPIWSRGFHADEFSPRLDSVRHGRILKGRPGRVKASVNRITERARLIMTDNQTLLVMRE
jgi:hypothetical protein